MKLSNILPKTFGMEDLIPGERLIAIIKRHLFYFFKRIFFIALLLIAIWAVFIFLFSSLGNLPQEYEGLAKNISIGIFIFINLIVLIRFLYLWVDFHFDNLIVTSQKIVFIDRHFIYGQTVREIDLTKITTVTSERTSFLANILGYARLVIDSADDGKHIIFDYTPRVEEVRSVIAAASQEVFNKRFSQNNVIHEQANQPIPPASNLVNENINLSNELEILRNEYNFLKQKVNFLEEEISKLRKF